MAAMEKAATASRGLSRNGMTMRQTTGSALIVACFLLAASIFMIDVLVFPLGVAAAVPYVAVILISLSLPRRQHVLYAAVAVSALTILGYFWSDPAGIWWMVLANRFLALFAIWVTAIVGYQRKRTEEALRESEVRLRAMLNTATDAIITVDQRGIITGVNPATERMFGYTQDELVGQNVKILMPSPFKDEHDGYIARFLETGEARIIGIGREVVGRHKDGSTFPVSLAVSNVDHLRLFTGIIRDISERKKLQRDVLHIAEDEQRRIGQDLHDSTQQELAGMGLLAQTLLDNLSKEPGELEAAGAPRPSELVTKIVDGIARTHQEVQAISRGLVPIRLGAQGLMDALRELASRTDDLEGVTCAFKCEQPVEIADSLTATHLYRIAQEATTNALKHGHPEHILIALESEDGQAILQVADDGVGFDSTQENEGMGLKTMLYRASLIAASVTVKPVEAGGTLVTCRVSGGGNIR